MILAAFWKTRGAPEIQNTVQKLLLGASGGHFGGLPPPMGDFGSILLRFCVVFESILARNHARTQNSKGVGGMGGAQLNPPHPLRMAGVWSFSKFQAKFVRF